jgi:three-Cys-motif partner protein
LSDVLTAASWDLAAHTAAKLEILGAYLRAWFPILGRSPAFDRIIYIDGFAGPGRYKQGEDGSPIIALKAAIGAISGQIQKPFEFHFVERKRRVASTLNANIQDLKRGRAWPENITITVHPQQTFQQAYESQIRARLLAHPRAPAFALVDPFGWTGIPLTILSELMKRQSTEILVNFMFEEINRFINHPDQGHNFDGLFGCEGWRKAESMAGGERKKFIVDLYRDQLSQRAGARHVRSFEMCSALRQAARQGAANREFRRRRHSLSCNPLSKGSLGDGGRRRAQVSKSARQSPPRNLRRQNGCA